MRALFRWPIGLPLILIAAMLSIAFVGGIIVTQEIYSLQQRSTENYIWLFTQAELEFNRLRIAAADPGLAAAEGPTAMQDGFARFSRAFDIYYSRIEQLTPVVSTYGTVHSNHPGIGQDFKQIEEFRDRFAAKLDGAGADFSQAMPDLLVMIAAAEEHHRTFVVNAVTDMHQENARDWQEVERKISIIGATYCLFLGMLVMLALWLWSVAERLRRRSIKSDMERMRFAAMVDAAPYRLVMCQGNGTIMHLNTAASALLGVPRADVIGRRIDGFLDKSQSLAEMALPDGARWRTSIVTPAATGLKVEASHNFLQLPDYSSLALFGFRDISDEVRLESSVIEARIEASSAREARIQFVEFLNHEIRTPLQQLSAVIGRAGWPQHGRVADTKDGVEPDEAVAILADFCRRVDLALAFASGEPVRSADVTTPDAENIPEEPVAFVPRRRVLVVEDHDVNRRLIAGMISNLGHDVIAAASGEQGVKLALAQKFDVIMMDLALPGIDGIEAMRRINADIADDTIPRFVAISAHARLLDGSRLIGAGFASVLRKPVLPDQLAAAITGGPSGHHLFATSDDWIDSDQLSAIQSILAEGELSALLDGLFLEAGHVATLVHTWANTGDMATIEADAHRTGGLAGMLGAARLAEVLYRIEDLATRDDHAAARAVVGQLDLAIAAMRQAVNKLLSGASQIKPSGGRFDAPNVDA